MRKMNRGQRNAWLQEFVAPKLDVDRLAPLSLTETTIVPYSKAWNRTFTEQIQTTLPVAGSQELYCTTHGLNCMYFHTCLVTQRYTRHYCIVSIVYSKGADE